MNTSTIRPLLFTDADTFAGTESHILELTVALKKLNCDSAIACPVPSPLAQRAADAGIAVINIQKRGLFDAAAVRTLVKLLRNGTINVIHAHNGRTHFIAARAIRKAGCGKLIATQHFWIPTRATRKGPKAYLANMLHRFADKKTAHTIAISHPVYEAALARKDTSADRISIIHNGITPPDCSAFTPPAAIREELQIAADTPMIFCAARLQKEKELPVLLEAMAILAKTHPQARCIIAGDGDEHESLQQTIQTLGIAKTTKLIGFRKDVPALMNAADLFVLPSPVEGFGLVFVEAMALGKPLVAINAGGPVDIVQQDLTGLLVPPRDPQAMAEALRKLLDHPDLRKAFSHTAKNRFAEHFTAQRMAAKVLALYQKIGTLREPHSA